MIELTRFQRRLIRFQSPAFDFERASVALLARLKHHPSFANKPPSESDRRDCLGFRIEAHVSQGGMQHG